MAVVASKASWVRYPTAVRYPIAAARIRSAPSVDRQSTPVAPYKRELEVGRWGARSRRGAPSRVEQDGGHHDAPPISRARRGGVLCPQPGATRSVSLDVIRYSAPAPRPTRKRPALAPTMSSGPPRWRGSSVGEIRRRRWVIVSAPARSEASHGDPLCDTPLPPTDILLYDVRTKRLWWKASHGDTCVPAILWG